MTLESLPLVYQHIMWSELFRNVDFELDRSTDKTTRIAFVTFADHKEVQGVVKNFGGYMLRNGEALISLPMGKFRESLRTK